MTAKQIISNIKNTLNTIALVGDAQAKANAGFAKRRKSHTKVLQKHANAYLGLKKDNEWVYDRSDLMELLHKENKDFAHGLSPFTLENIASQAMKANKRNSKAGRPDKENPALAALIALAKKKAKPHTMKKAASLLLSAYRQALKKAKK